MHGTRNRSGRKVDTIVITVGNKGFSADLYIKPDPDEPYGLTLEGRIPEHRIKESSPDLNKLRALLFRRLSDKIKLTWEKMLCIDVDTYSCRDEASVSLNYEIAYTAQAPGGRTLWMDEDQKYYTTRPSHAVAIAWTQERAEMLDAMKERINHVSAELVKLVSHSTFAELLDAGMLQLPAMAPATREDTHDA